MNAIEDQYTLIKQSLLLSKYSNRAVGIVQQSSHYIQLKFVFALAYTSQQSSQPGI